METFRIPLNDPNTPRAARNSHRIFVEVDVIPTSGKGDRYRLPCGKSRAEIYTAELDRWVSMVRTPDHEAVYTAARAAAQAAQEGWLVAAGLQHAPAEEKARAVATLCHEPPEKYLANSRKVLENMGQVSRDIEPGMPPFRSLRVCTKDLTTSVPLEEYLRADDAEKSRTFHIDPPTMPENVHEAANRRDEAMYALFKKLLDQSGDKAAAPKRGRG